MARNLADTAGLIRKAASQGATFVATPEMTNILDPDRPRLRGLAKAQAEDDSVAGFSTLAAELGIWLNVGSLALMGRSRHVDQPVPALRPRRKAAGPLRQDPSVRCRPADRRVVARVACLCRRQPSGGFRCRRVPTGTDHLLRCSLSGLYRQLAQAGAEVITVPSAFTVPTGEAHWHVLLRAGAIETGSFILAAAQAGRHESGRETYGHSLAVAPGARCWPKLDRIPVQLWSISTLHTCQQPGAGSRHLPMTGPLRSRT